MGRLLRDRGRPVVSGGDARVLDAGTQVQLENRRIAHEGQELAPGITYAAHLDPVVARGELLATEFARLSELDPGTSRQIRGILRQILHCHDCIEDNDDFDVSTFVDEPNLHPVVGLVIGVMSMHRGQSRDSYQEQLAAERTRFVVAHSERDKRLEAHLQTMLTAQEIDHLPYYIDLFVYLGKTADSIAVNLDPLKAGGVYEADLGEHRRKVTLARSRAGLDDDETTVDRLAEIGMNFRRLDQIGKRGGHLRALRTVAARSFPGITLAEDLWRGHERTGLFAHRSHSSGGSVTDPFPTDKGPTELLGPSRRIAR